jgi:hypothetical protein
MMPFRNGYDTLYTILGIQRSYQAGCIVANVVNLGLVAAG